MSVVLTRDFGEVACDASSEWFFPQGLPGFEDQNRFVLIERPSFAPVLFLQSLSTAQLCFLAVPVWVVDPSYQVGMTRADLDTLELSSQPAPGDGTLCLAILSAGGDSFTANLLAPVVVNLETRTALQAVRTDAIYSHLHPMHVEALPCL